jgi:3-phenylpropionate/cinnamic acid dioxygenase small subunit
MFDHRLSYRDKIIWYFDHQLRHPTSSRQATLPQFVLSNSRRFVQDEGHTRSDLITNIRIHGEAGGAYRVSANYLVLHTTEEGETRIYSTGKYQDEIVFTETGPKFLKKIVIADTSAIDTLLAVPL